MKFSFPDDCVFRIEEDEEIRSRKGVKACECIVFINNNVALIEAKASSPRNNNKEKFSEFIDEIRQKFADSLRIFTDIKSKSLGNDAFSRLPAKLQTATDDKSRYKIYLVIHGHREEWLIGLLDALRDALSDVVKRWNMRDSNIKVLNEQGALEHNLIVAFIPASEVHGVQKDGNMDQILARKWFDEHS
jgi:hypothetical protein